MSRSYLAFVGGEERALCFRGMGFDVFPARTSEELSAFLPILRKNQYAIIFTEWRFYDAIKTHFEDLRGEALPVICAIPTSSVEVGRGGDIVRRLVEMAIGSSIMIQGEEKSP
ncbi:V-type ATP synthase subunit F [Candidatus Caldatribacterium saccharofermentans]|uniref:V-type ATP synthase subunit F n=1 Tax=Candidatus Caldatribacterium saccharofermentans TaxID=1454753 RepID=A0A7V4TIT2_9BACT